MATEATTVQNASKRYLRKIKLQRLLEELFPKVAVADFDIQVSLTQERGEGERGRGGERRGGEGENETKRGLAWAAY